MTRALYIVGAPGSGKSTAVRGLLAGMPLGESLRLDARFPLVRGQRFERGDWRSSGVLLGGDHPLFPGTDRLSMGVAPQAIRWLRQGDLPDILVGEGARLGNAKFLTALAEAARLVVVHLDPPADVVAERRAARGTGQNEQWVRGATTGARNAADACERAGIHVLRMSAISHPADLWQILD